jgi:hypothetical protein
MWTEPQIEAAARAIDPNAFYIYDKGFTAQNAVEQRQFLRAEKRVKMARNHARRALAAVSKVSDDGQSEDK